jgi:hypothetical protein
MQTMHLLPGVAIQPNLELKTRPKLVLGSLTLAFALPALTFRTAYKPPYLNYRNPKHTLTLEVPYIVPNAAKYICE